MVKGRTKDDLYPLFDVPGTGFRDKVGSRHSKFIFEREGVAEWACHTRLSARA
jgi:hypothetical protein